MKFLKKIFGKKEEAEPLREVENPQPIVAEEEVEEVEVIGTCQWCNTDILSVHKWSKQQGMKFHRGCYKKLLKAGRG